MNSKWKYHFTEEKENRFQPKTYFKEFYSFK